MELSPRVSEASLRTVTDANAVLVTIPDEITNELTTNVRVRDGKTLVLGGLFREKNDISRRQVPLLGDVPVLGWAFRGQEDSVDRDEIIFMITPNIVNDEKLWDIGEDTLQYARAFVVGGRDGLLPFSREKLTSGYNQDATAAFNRGDHDMALYYINNSLRLRPMQPEMIRFRETVTGAIEQPHLRSMMERVLKENLRNDLESAQMNIMKWQGTVGSAHSHQRESSSSQWSQTPAHASSSAAHTGDMNSGNAGDFVEVDWLKNNGASSWYQTTEPLSSTSSHTANPSTTAADDAMETDGSAEQPIEVTEGGNDPFEVGASSSFDDAPMANDSNARDFAHAAQSQQPTHGDDDETPAWNSTQKAETQDQHAGWSNATSSNESTFDSGFEPASHEDAAEPMTFDDTADEFEHSSTSIQVLSDDDWSRADNEFYRGFLADFFKAIGMPVMTGPATATQSFLGLSQADFDANQADEADAGDFAEADSSPFEE
jgi:hypothetical protein